MSDFTNTGDHELIALAEAADAYGETFKRPKTAGQKVTLFGNFVRVGRGPSAYSTAADGRADFVVIDCDGDLTNVYISEREFAELARIAPKHGERLAFVFERITTRDGSPFNKLSMAKAGQTLDTDWQALTTERGIPTEPTADEPGGGGGGGGAIDLGADIPFMPVL